MSNVPIFMAGIDHFVDTLSGMMLPEMGLRSNRLTLQLKPLNSLAQKFREGVATEGHPYKNATGIIGTLNVL